MEHHEMEMAIEKAVHIISNSKNIIVFIGAGVSTESGIPNLRSPNGIWAQYDPEDFTYQKYLARSETREKIWKMQDLLDVSEANPNSAHLTIAELETLEKLNCIITQNIDNLHQKAGNSDEKVIELHGNMKKIICLNCGITCAREEIDERVQSGEKDPYCHTCLGILKPATIFIREAMPVAETREAERRSQSCEAFTVVGSSLVVYPAANIPL